MQNTITPKQRLDYIMGMLGSCIASGQPLRADILEFTIRNVDSTLKAVGFVVCNEDAADPIPNSES